MKKTVFALLMFAVTTMAFTGCEKDDKDNKDSVSIVGKWGIVKTEVAHITKGQVTTETASGNGEWTFYSNGTSITSLGERTYNVVDNPVVRKLRFDVGSGDYVDYEILKLTSSELILYGLEMDDAENGISVKIDFRKM